MATDLAEAGDKGEQVMDTFTNDERRELGYEPIEECER